MAVPASLKSVQPYWVIAKQFEKRDLVTTYYVSMYAVQEGIKLASKDPDAKAYLFTKMNDMDLLKRQLLQDDQTKEAIESDVVGGAHVENVALKIFDHADGQDRAANFNKALIKSFFTASQIFSVLKQFGELSEEAEEKMKYAKWKAVEIGRCLKNGIAPTPGPPGGNEEGAVGFYPSPPGPGDSTPQDDKPVPKPRQNIHPPAGYPLDPPASYPPLDPPASYPPNPPAGYPLDPPGSYPSHPQPIYPPAPQPSHPPSYDPASAGQTRGQLPPAADPPRSVKAVGGTGGVSPRALGPEDVAKVQKMCKFASSALDYDDPAGAIEYLQDALALLTTAKNS